MTWVNLRDIVNLVSPGMMAGGTVLVLFLTLIQVSPIRLNPWDRLFEWLGGKLNGRLHKQVRDLWINTHRQVLLTFARECRNQMEHSADEWAYVLNIADEYEIYCEKNDVTNGVVKEDTRYIRELYQELSRGHRIH